MAYGIYFSSAWTFSGIPKRKNNDCGHSYLFLKEKIMIVDIVISMVDAGVWLHNFNVCL